jgi:flagellar biosynthesis/type III secretory pathway M-ring protein FliF/YscJ
MPAGYEAQMTAARSSAQQDPKRVAQVVKQWVATDG